MNVCHANVVETSLTLLLIAAFSAGLAGCTSSPSAGDGEHAIRDRIKQESEGRITLTKFQKDNGIRGEMMGFKVYKLEFTAELEFVEDCKWLGDPVPLFGFRTSKVYTQNEASFASFLEKTTNPGEIVKKNQLAQISGVITFVKKENGWAVDSMEFSKGIGLLNSPQSDHVVEAPRQSNSELKIKAAKMIIAGIKSSVNVFEVDMSRYPKNLTELIQKPSDGDHPGPLSINSWHGPYYIDGAIPKDPWGNDYIYRNPGAHTAFDVFSAGPDGRVGTEDDVTN